MGQRLLRSGSAGHSVDEFVGGVGWLVWWRGRCWASPLLRWKPMAVLRSTAATAGPLPVRAW